MLQRYKKILVALFNQVKELQSSPVRNRLLALEIQEQLLICIGNTERIIRKTRTQIKLLKNSLSKRNNNKESSRSIKEKIKKESEKINRQKLLAWILRSIGDSIAFIYGDRWDLKNYFQKHDAGFITGKKGTRLERAILRQAYVSGATVVMNDLTNTLRHGDIALFRPDLWPDGDSPCLLFELKSGRGGNKERLERQKNAIKEIFSYLTTDVKETAEGNWVRVSAKEKPKHHFAALEKLGNSLVVGGWLFEEVEPGLYYLIIHTQFNQNISELLSSLFIDVKTLFALSVYALKEQTFGYYPFPLCFNNPDLLYKFYNGEFVMFVFVDIDKVNKFLQPQKIGLALSNMPGRSLKIISGDKSDSNLEDLASFVGDHMVGRLAGEFLRLDWIIENVIAQPTERLAHVQAIK